MKFIKYRSLMAVALATVFVACDPLDEVYDEIEGIQNDKVSKTLELTLTEEDYELLEEVPGGAGAANYKNFDSPDEPKVLVPYILESKFPNLGNKSSAKVTYHYYSPVRVNDEIDHTMTTQEYYDLGESYPNFSSEGDLINAAKTLYPSAENEDVLTLTYDYYTGAGVETRTSKLSKYEGRWFLSYEPTSEDYAFMGQSYPNFDSRSTGRARIAVLLDNKFPFAEEGDIRTSVFTYTYTETDDNGDQRRVYEDFLVTYVFDGANWVGVEDVTLQTLQFGHDGENWVPDNTIKYIFEANDYSKVAQEFETSYPDQVKNLNQYGNFNRADPNGGGSSWSTELMYEVMAFILSDGDFVQEEGQKYIITVDTYGAAPTEDFSMIFENGEWVENPDA